MSFVKICGFYDSKTYVVPCSVQEKNILQMSAEEFLVFCRMHGGIDRVLYHLACQISTNHSTFLDCISYTENMLQMHFGEREWTDLIQ